ncbi:MAG: class I fructose-bisphosphate aldolase [bacterium]
MTDLVEIARGLFAEGKGLLAADESVKSADERLALYGIEGGEESRRKFRDLFLAAPGAESYLSGTILFEETLTQKSESGVPFPELLASNGIAPGIKVDEGTEPFPESPHELITKGLIGLPERLAPYRAAGAVFTKWRAVIGIDGDHVPSAPALVENAKRLASFARICQEAGLVPILEPEVLRAGKHSRLRAKGAIRDTLMVLFKAVEDQVADRTALILKTSMVVSGSDSSGVDTPEQVALDTLDVLMETVPKDVPGILFLSGGQSFEVATANLQAIVREGKKRGAPWPLTFCFARALQEDALKIWQGKEENVEAARAAYLGHLTLVSSAARGQ